MLLLRASENDLAPLSARIARPDDATGIARIAYQGSGLALNRTAAESRRLLAEPYAFSVVIERTPLRQKPRIVGVQTAALIRPWFAKEVLKGDEPYFQVKVRSSTRSPFPSDREVGKANGSQGLHLFLAYHSIDERLPREEALRAETMLTDFFAEQFAGNRIKSILVDTYGPPVTDRAKRGGFRELSRYGRWRQEKECAERDAPTLLEMTAELAEEYQNFQLLKLFQYKPPVLRFKSGCRDLLRLAHAGLKDHQIAERLSISPKSVEDRWRLIFDRAIEVAPDLFDSADRRKLRVPVLEYVKNHPEERWPYVPA
jgi:hypothetical protein